MNGSHSISWECGRTWEGCFKYVDKLSVYTWFRLQGVENSDCLISVLDIALVLESKTRLEQSEDLRSIPALRGKAKCSGTSLKSQHGDVKSSKTSVLVVRPAYPTW